MTYATLQDLIERFGETELIQLTDRVNRPVTTIDPVVVERALSDAQAEIDSYIGKVAKLPVAKVPPILTKRAADMARYFLFGSKAEKDGEVERGYKEALAWLRDVSKGVVQMDFGGVVAPAPATSGVSFIAPARRFTRDSQRGL